MLNIWEIIVLIVVFYVFLFFYFKSKRTEHEFNSIVNHTFRTPLTRINWISREIERIRYLRKEDFICSRC